MPETDTAAKLFKGFKELCLMFTKCLQEEALMLQMRLNEARRDRKLSEDDITTISGQRDQFARLLQERYGYAQELAESAVDQFAERIDLPIEALDSVPVGPNTN